MKPAQPLRERILRSVVLDETGCWLWLHRADRDGYGRIAFGGGVKEAAHRIAYETFAGPIPDGMQLDHTCHNRDRYCLGGRACLHRRCVNPSHLEPVTLAQNIDRAHVRRALAVAS